MVLKQSQQDKATYASNMAGQIVAVVAGFLSQDKIEKEEFRNAVQGSIDCVFERSAERDDYPLTPEDEKLLSAFLFDRTTGVLNEDGHLALGGKAHAFISQVSDEVKRLAFLVQSDPDLVQSDPENRPFDETMVDTMFSGHRPEVRSDIKRFINLAAEAVRSAEKDEHGKVSGGAVSRRFEDLVFTPKQGFSEEGVPMSLVVEAQTLLEGTIDSEAPYDEGTLKKAVLGLWKKHFDKEHANLKRCDASGVLAPR